MRNMTEERVALAYKLYEARRAAKLLLGERYDHFVGDAKTILQKLADTDHGGNVLQAAMRVLVEMQEDCAPGNAQIIMLAAAVDLIEPEEGNQP